MDPYINYYLVNTYTYDHNSCAGQTGSITTHYSKSENTNPEFFDMTSDKTKFFHHCLCIIPICISSCGPKKWVVEKGAFFHNHPSYEWLTDTEECPAGMISTYKIGELTGLLNKIEKCRECTIYFPSTSDYANNGQEIINDEHEKLEKLVQTYISSCNREESTDE